MMILLHYFVHLQSFGYVSENLNFPLYLEAVLDVLLPKELCWKGFSTYLSISCPLSNFWSMASNQNHHKRLNLQVFSLTYLKEEKKKAIRLSHQFAAASTELNNNKWVLFVVDVFSLLKTETPQVRCAGRVPKASRVTDSGENKEARECSEITKAKSHKLNFQ